MYNGMLFSYKKNDVLKHATTQVNLEDIMLGEKSDTKDKDCLISLM